MARFRLPPPFNDPEDDVVFPQSHGGNFRTPALREDKPIARSARRTWLVAGSIFAVVVALGGLYTLRVISRGEALATDRDGMRAPAPVPAPAPSPPVETRNSRPPPASVPYRIDPGDGMISLSTDMPARCTIRWVRFQTPVMDEGVPAGYHPAECVSLDGTRRARFDVTILRNTATPRLIALDEAVYPPEPPPPIGPSPLPRRPR